MGDYAERLLAGGSKGRSKSKWSDRLLSAAPSPQAAPSYAPIPSEISPQDLNIEPASVGDVATASLANDPQARIKWYAKQRGIPESRYSIKGGEIGFKDAFGKWRPEVKGIGSRIARGTGPAIPAATGAIGGILSAPMLLAGPPGVAGSIAATAGATALGQGTREALANTIMGQEMSPARIGMEAAYGGLGQGIGGGLTAWAQRGAAKDIARLNRPAMSALGAKAKAQGVHLTPAEQSNLTSLKAQQKALGNLTQSSDTMDDFYRLRAEQVDDATGQFLNRISPEDSAEVAGTRAREAARGAISSLKEARREAARPLYKKAFSSNQSIDSRFLDRVLATPAGREALGRARTKMQNDMTLLGKPDKELSEQVRLLVSAGKMKKVGQVARGLKLRTFDYVKRAFDDMVSEADRAGKPDDARILKNLRAGFRNELDKLDVTARAGPRSTKVEGGAYKQAREAFAGRSPEITQMEESVVGVVSRLKDATAQQAAKKLFSPTSIGPVSAKGAKEAIKKSDPAAWQAIKRSYLDDMWQRAGKEYATVGKPLNRGAKFRALVLGDLKQRAILKNVLEKQEWKALNDLSQVLDAAGRVKPLGSDTAWNQEMMKVARNESTPFLAKIARGLRPQDWGRMIEDWATERSLAKNASKMADIITSPEAAKHLKELRQLSPSGARFRVGVAHLLVRFGGASLSEIE